MDYIDLLYQDIKNETVFNEFVKNILNLPIDDTLKISNILFHSNNNHSCLTLEIAHRTNFFVLSFDNFKIKAMEVNDQFCNPNCNGYTSRFLKFMGNKYPSYAQDCINHVTEQCNKDKQNKLAELNEIFGGSDVHKQTL